MFFPHPNFTIERETNPGKLPTALQHWRHAFPGSHQGEIMTSRWFLWSDIRRCQRDFSIQQKFSQLHCRDGEESAGSGAPAQPESRPRLLETLLHPHQLPPRLSQQLEELTTAFQRSAKCQVSGSCWQASPKGMIFCCHHLLACFFLVVFLEKKSPGKCPPPLNSFIIAPLPAAASSPRAACATGPHPLG